VRKNPKSKKTQGSPLLGTTDPSRSGGGDPSIQTRVPGEPTSREEAVDPQPVAPNDPATPPRKLEEPLGGSLSEKKGKTRKIPKPSKRGTRKESKVFSVDAPLKIGIDARLAYRRGVGAYAANLILSLSLIDKKNEYFLFNAPFRLRQRVANPRFHWVNLPFSNAASYEQILLPRAARGMGLSFLHYVDNSGTILVDYPFVLTVHDTMHSRPLAKAYPRPTFRQRLVFAYKKWAIPRAVRKAKAVLTVSEYSKNGIVAETGIPSGKVSVTPEGVDPEVFHPIARNPSPPFKILVHGAADDRKNLPNIFEAARLLADKGMDFRLGVMGMAEDELTQAGTLRDVAEWGLERYVDWAGQVPSEGLNRVYAESDLLLYPSRWEGFGLPVLEAFACGVPVVASNTTSLPEVAGNAALLVDPESPQAIAEAVKWMMEKETSRNRLIQRGLKRAKEFTWEKTAELTLGVYNQMKQQLE